MYVFFGRLSLKSYRSYSGGVLTNTVKIRNATLQKKESLTSKYSKIPNVIYCEGMI
jgi:hypothetical protein